MKKFIKIFLYAAMLILVIGNTVGCQNSSKKNLESVNINEKIEKDEKSGISSSNNLSITDNSLPDQSIDKDNINFNIPDNISKRISLGSYDEIIRLGGSQRDPKKIIFRDRLMVLPEGKVVTLTSKTNGTLERFINITSEEVKELVSIIESSEIIDEEQIKKNVNQKLGAEINLIILNTSAEFIHISIIASNDNIHWLRIYNEDPKKDMTNLCIQSEALTDKIKKLSEWKTFSNSDIVRATKVTGIDYYNNLNKEFELSDDEVELLKSAIKEAKPTVLESGCPFDLSFVVTLDNGEVIHMLWADDSCGFIGIEGSAYKVSESYIKQINEMLNIKSSTPR